MAFCYTLCFNIHKPVLFCFVFACIFLFHYCCDLWLLTCLFLSPNNSILQSISTTLLFFFKWCILLMYICSVLCFQLPLPNLSIRWSWTENQMGVLKGYWCICIIYKDIFCVLKWRLVVYYLWPLDVTLWV